MADEVQVSFGLTLNLGNYESARIDALYKTTVKDGETLDEAYERAWTVVDEQVASKTEAQEK